MADRMAVRVSVIGHASQRWQSAKSSEEAAHHNYALSYLRAATVRRFVADLLRSHLGRLNIPVNWKAVGSAQRMPGPADNNSAIDRCVEVRIDLHFLYPNGAAVRVANPPLRTYMATRQWVLRVISVLGGVAGPAGVLLNVAIRNSITGKELKLRGELGGGGVPLTPKDAFIFDRKSNPAKQQVGHEVPFQTSEVMDFEDWGRDRWVKLELAEAKFFLTEKLGYLQFVGLKTSPADLRFQAKTGVGLKLGGKVLEVTGNWRLMVATPGTYL